MSIAVYLDFSSAFDTIDHSIPIHFLHNNCGFTATVLQWFSSYLTDRTQHVSLSNNCSGFAPVHSSVQIERLRVNIASVPVTSTSTLVTGTSTANFFVI